jgi:hypothetical protein
MATSSPSLISRSHCGESSPSTSTYSRLTVKAQLLSTLGVMPEYRASSSENRSRALTGAGSSSVDLAVKLAAAAKYKMEKWPFAGAIAAVAAQNVSSGPDAAKDNKSSEVSDQEERLRRPATKRC